MALVFITNMIAYYGTHIINNGRAYHSVVMAVDRKIPFIEPFIYVYVLAFLQWIICYITACVKDGEKCGYFAFGASFANLICMVCFIAYPTIMTIRPEINGGSITDMLTRYIFAADTPPVNLLPSIHCLESWICLRMVFSLKGVPRAVKYANAAFSCLVFASVLLVKQHALADVPAGIAAAEAGLFLARLILKKHNNVKGEAK